jgi:hypothetical protein
MLHLLLMKNRSILQMWLCMKAIELLLHSRLEILQQHSRSSGQMLYSH